MVILEYAQHRNGRFAGWIDGGEFPSRAAALKVAAERGLIGEGDEFLINEYRDITGDGCDERGTRNLFDCG